MHPLNQSPCQDTFQTSDAIRNVTKPGSESGLRKPNLRRVRQLRGNFLPRVLQHFSAWVHQLDSIILLGIVGGRDHNPDCGSCKFLIFRITQKVM